MESVAYCKRALQQRKTTVAAVDSGEFGDVCISRCYDVQYLQFSSRSKPKSEVLCGPAGKIARNLITVYISRHSSVFDASRDPFPLQKKCP